MNHWRALHCSCIAFSAFENPDKPVAFLLAEVHPSSRSPVRCWQAVLQLRRPQYMCPMQH